MRPRLLLALSVLLVLTFAGCGNGGAKSNGGTALKDVHDPKLAATATPPLTQPTPLAAVGVSSGAGTGGTAPDVYVVKSGDTLGAIAQNLGVSVDDLVKANNITDPTRIQVGQQLKVPKLGAATATPGPGAPLGSPGPASTSTSGGAQIPPTGGAPSGAGAVGTPAPGASPTAAGTARPGATAAASGSGTGTEYTVKSGDTGCTIAKANGVSVAELAQANGVTAAQLARLQVGQLLKIPPRTGHTDC